MAKIKKEEQVEVLPDAVIHEREWINVMRENMATFGAYVNEQRAIINDFDWLKPVHRRILYTFYYAWLKSSDKFTKCSKIAWDTMANFHPHWSSYWALTRLVQPFTLNIPLIVGQWNFGSLDTEAAADRYTECKISKFVEDVLFDEIKYKNIPFTKNYTGTLDEIVYFPAKLPLGLINSNMWIWYGLASNIAGYNINELIDAMVWLIQDETFDITKVIKGPDFPSKWKIISPKEAIDTSLLTWKGSVRIRGNINVDNEENALIITELPYNVSPKDVENKILELQQSDKKSKISDIANLSANGQISIAVYYKKGTNLLKERNVLYKKAKLETSVSLNLMALKDNTTPTLMSMKEYLLRFIKFRKNCFESKTRTQIDILEKRLHILEAYRKLKNEEVLEDIIHIIRKYPWTKEERNNHLMEKYEFSKIQVENIVWLRLDNLAPEYFSDVDSEYEDKTADKNDKLDILANRLTQEIINEWNLLKSKYWYVRRTQVEEEADISDSMENFTEDKEVTIIYTENGYIKRVDSSDFRSQNRGGTGSSAIHLKDDDSIKMVIPSNFHDKILFVSNKWNFYSCRGWDIPEGNKGSKGIPLLNFIDCKEEGEVIEFIFSLTKEDLDKNKLLIVYSDWNGVKVSCQNALPKRNWTKFVPEGKKLVSVNLIKNEKAMIIIWKKFWLWNKFSIESISEKKSVWQWVKLTSFKTENDEVVWTTIAENDEVELLILSKNGFAKRITSADVRQSNRGWKWVKIGIKTGDELVGLIWLNNEEDKWIKIITNQGKLIATNTENFRQMGRNSKGVKAINLKEDDFIKTVIL